jgi:hypothetical protein
MAARSILSAAFLPLFAIVAGCSVSPRLVTRTDPSPANLPRQLAVEAGLPDGETAAPVTAGFVQTLSDRLASRGITNQPGNPYRLTVALSLAPANLGITQDDGSDPRKIAWRAEPRRKGSFDNCRPQRLRAVLSFEDGKLGGNRQLADGEYSACRIGDAEAKALAKALADALTRH